MNKEELQRRKTALLSDHYLLVGHLQELDYWLEQEDEAPAHPPAEAATNEQRETAVMPRPRRRSAQ